VVLSPTWTTIRLFVHVLAASVWVGGQIVLVSIVPAIRASHPEATKLIAVAYGRVAWPAFVILVVTGIWNLADVAVSDTDVSYQVSLLLKIALALVSGAAAVVHQVGRSRLALAVGGAVGFSTALAAMFVGTLLGTGS
jgi:putative copper export protein